MSDSSSEAVAVRDLDHLVYAVPDLAAGVAAFAARTGVAPARGGSHTGLGTANALVGLGGSAYLEIVGPDPAQPEPARPRPFGIDDLDTARLVTWAVHPPDVDGVIARARALGSDPGDAFAMSRRTPDGDELRWRLTPDRGVVPFLIDWGATPHPTTRALPEVGVVSFAIGHPSPDVVRRDLAAIGIRGVDVEPADAPGLSVVLDTPRGRVTL